MGVKDYRSADHTVTLWDEGKNAYTITDGRLTKDQSVGLKQYFDGEPANYAHYWSSERDPKGEVISVTHENVYLPEKGGEILDAIHTEKPVPDQPDMFYNASYLQVDHFTGGLKPLVTYPIPNSISPPLVPAPK